MKSSAQPNGNEIDKVSGRHGYLLRQKQGSQTRGPQEDDFGPRLRIKMKIFERIGMFL